MPKTGFAPIDKTNTISNPSNGLAGKPPAVARPGYGVFTSSGKQHGSATSNGLRSNSNGPTIQNPGMAESLRAQIATPRNNQVN